MGFLVVVVQVLEVVLVRLDFRVQTYCERFLKNFLIRSVNFIGARCFRVFLFMD